MRNAALLGLIGALAMLAGCGHDCQDTCQHIYDPSECGIVKGGETSEELIRTCLSECNEAMKHNGELDGYEPYSHSSSLENFRLENEKQAALWMECVWDVAPDDGPSAGCNDLDPATGVCAPI